MQERHKNRKLYFDEQSYTTAKYVIPYISKFKKIDSNTKVLEIGCGEGGNLKPFVDMGCQCVGIDLNEQQIRNAEMYFTDNKQLTNGGVQNLSILISTTSIPTSISTM